MNTNPGELVAVDGAVLAMDEPALKHLAVLFPRIAVAGLAGFPNTNVDPSEFVKARAELMDAGVLFAPVISPARNETVELVIQDLDQILKPTTGLNAKEFIEARKDQAKYSQIRTKYSQIRKKSRVEMFKNANLQKLMNAGKRLSTNGTRVLTAQLREAENLDACAVVPAEFNSLDFEDDDESSNSHDVMKIVLTSLPAPSDDVTWKQIIEYRSDPESYVRFMDLKNWMTDTACGKLTPVEIREKLESVLDQYRKHFIVHQMNTINATLEAFIVSSADVLRSLATVRWGKTESIFTLERRRLTLLEEESKTGGTVVAFVIKTEIFEWCS